MHQRISTTLKTLRQDLATGLGGDFIVKACRAAGHTWSDSCLLTPAAIIHWFLVQIFHGNTALHHVSLLAGRAFTASAFCQARAALPLAVYRAVLREMVKGLIPATEKVGLCLRPSHISRGRLGVLHARYPRAASPLRPARWTGQRLRLPDSPHPGAVPRRHRAPPGGHRGARCGLMTWPASSESFLCSWPATSWWLTAASARLPIWRLLMAKEAHAVFRVHQKQIVDFTPGRAHARPGQKRVPKGIPRSRWVSACGLMDQLVEYFKPVQRPKWMSEDEYRVLPESIMVRAAVSDHGGRVPDAQVAAGNDALGCRGVPG